MWLVIHLERVYLETGLPLSNCAVLLRVLSCLDSTGSACAHPWNEGLALSSSVDLGRRLAGVQPGLK